MTSTNSHHLQIYETSLLADISMTTAASDVNNDNQCLPHPPPLLSNNDNPTTSILQQWDDFTIISSGFALFQCLEPENQWQ